MPELPEIEIARDNLERWLRGRRILAVRVRDRRVLREQSPKPFRDLLEGARIAAVDRRGKFLMLAASGRGKVLAHLGMTGKFVRRSPGEADPPAVRVELALARGARVLFVDPRRFGRMQVLDASGEVALSRLGIEPLGPEFTPARLARLLERARLAIKPFLLDQSRIAGLGNIYAAEALFRAGVHPARGAASLSRVDVSKLHRSIRATLGSAIRRDGGDEIHYLQERDAANRFAIYGREGEPCRRCRAPIRRMIQSGRSSYYCEVCQIWPKARP